MTISAYTFKLPVNAPKVNKVDTVVVMADSAAHARELLESYYPLTQKALWDAVASPSAEVAAADWKGFRFTVSITPTGGIPHVFVYTGLASDTSNLVAAALRALIVADTAFNLTTVATDTVTVPGATNAQGAAVITGKVEYTGGLATAFDAARSPYAHDNLQTLTAVPFVINAAGISSVDRTIQVPALTNAPRVVGLFEDHTAEA